MLVLLQDQDHGHDYEHWKHEDHANFAKPLDVMLDEHYQQHVQQFEAWQKKEGNQEKKKAIPKIDLGALNETPAT